MDVNGVKLERKQVYQVIGEIENSGKYSIGYFLNWDDAVNASKTRGLLGGDADIETIQGIVVNDMYFYLEDTEELLPLYHDDLSHLRDLVSQHLKKLRQTASTKLSEEERLAVGL